MRLPELLNANGNSRLHLPGINHAIALLSADDDVKAEVQARIDAGASITVREIEELKRQAKASEHWKECAQAAQSQAIEWKQKAMEAENALARQTPQIIERTLEVEVIPPDYDETKRQAELAATLQSELEQAQAQLSQLSTEIARKIEAGTQRGLRERQAELDHLEQRKDALERMVAARMERFTRFNAVLDANQEIADECGKLASAFGGFTATVSSHEIPGLSPRTRAQAERVRHLIDGAARALDLILSLPDLPTEYEIREAT
jgi:chromosome segregation ATPase